MSMTQDEPMNRVGSEWWRCLVDDRFGIVRHIVDEATPEFFPQSFRMTSAILADASCWAPWSVDSSGAGYAIGPQSNPLDAAVGEAIERYCGNIVTSTVRTSFTGLVDRGVAALDPSELALFSPEQYETARFPFIPFDESFETDWTLGRDLRTDRPTYVPAAMVWAAYPVAAATRGQRVTNPVYQPGLAAGQTVRHAVLAALLELIERDAMVLAWHGGAELHPIVAPPWLDQLGSKGDFTTRWFSFPNTFGVPVVGALVSDAKRGYLTMGVAARTEPASAACKALGEAFQLQRFVAGLDDVKGAYVSRIGRGSPLRSWRSDRRYLDSYAADFSDAVDDTCNLQLHLDQRMRRLFEAELADTLTDATIDYSHLKPDDARPLDDVDSIGHLVGQIIDATGRSPVVVDVTTTDVIESGSNVRVVRVTAPGLYANSSLAYPFLGGTRMTASLERSGRYRTIPLPH